MRRLLVCLLDLGGRLGAQPQRHMRGLHGLPYHLPATQECAQGVRIGQPGVQGEVLERDRGSCAFVAAPKLAELTASALEVRDSFVTSVLLPKKDGTSRGSPLRCATWPSMTGYRSWHIP